MKWPRSTFGLSRLPARSVRIYVLAALVGAGLGIVVALAVVILPTVKRLPKLTQTRLDAARAQWRQVAPQNYRLVVRVEGTQPGTYEVVVQGGRPVSASLNHRPLTQTRILGTWTVEGMFQTLERDLWNQEQSGDDSPLDLRAEFHEHWAYPVRYQRFEWGSSHQVTWEVVEFKAEG